MIDLTQLFIALLGLLCTLITYRVIPYIKSRTTAQQQAQIKQWVGIAVSAAEQLFSGSGLGNKKKAYVLKFLQDKGFTVDEAALNVLIESAVWQLKHAVSTPALPAHTETDIAEVASYE